MDRTGGICQELQIGGAKGREALELTYKPWSDRYL